MKKFLLVVTVVLMHLATFAQTYNNEWIDFSKTYYKFKVGRTGLYRLTSAALNTIGLANENVQNFQIWRNGAQVPLFTSVPSGAIGAGYIEFWGEQNDGVADKALYRNPAFQLSDRVSLQTDTAAFFLTVNSVGSNLRYTTTANNVAANVLPAEPYFIHALRLNFRDRLHRGYAIPAGGEYLYSSSYDIGEMWSTGDINPSTQFVLNFPNLAVANGGPSAAFTIGMAGSAPNGFPPNNRRYKVEINSNTIIDTILNQFDAHISSNPNVALSLIASNTATIKVSNTSTQINDRIVCSFYELKYPRQFNFGDQPNFNFSLAATASSKYLEITNFNTGGVPPVLYDLSNNRRYVSELSTSGAVRVVLQPSGVATNFVLVSQAATNVIPVSNFSTRNFVNYALPANQADYIIISNNRLRATYLGADQVDLFRAYRASVPGGSFNAKIYDIEQLVDQFAFGIKKHPISIKNFLRLTRASASVTPRFVFLVGKGVSYDEYRMNETRAEAELLNLVPTWGYPASDALFTSNTMEPVITTPIGRISVVAPSELAEYLNKVKQYEQAQQNNTQTIDNKAWMKTFVHVAGGNDPNLDVRLAGYLRTYENVIRDTSFGGTIVNFNKTSTGPVTPIVSSLMDKTFQNGLSLLNYFGHSSASSLDYNLDDPYSYNNTGKYPMFVVNGCNAGNLYSFEEARFSLLSTLSEKWVLAKNRGSIGFIASTHFGLENYLDYYNTGLYQSMGRTGYGKSIGENIAAATTYLRNLVGPNDFYGRIHAEETTLHGDPAIKLNTHSNADFVVEEPQIRIIPTIVSAADNNFTVKTYLHNIGKATGDSVSVLVARQYPNGVIETIYNRKIKSVRFIDSVTLSVPIIASRDKGENKITVTIDQENRYAELSEFNNTATKSFSIFEDELKPVYPYDLSIINKQGIKLTASTANPILGSRTYVMELDTTELFNSPFKVSKNITSIGGIVEFDAGVSFTDSTVYYWRVAPSTPTALRWNTASFTYLANSSLGYNQSHLYQHLKSKTDRMFIDSATRKWKFDTRLTNIIITNSIYPTSGTEDNQFSISVNGTINIASACLGHSIIYNVFDPVSMKPYFNQTVPSTSQSGALGGFMKSAGVCAATRQYNFEYSYEDSVGRRLMRDFLNWVPAGAYVTARIILDGPYDQTPWASQWKNDEQVYGVGNTLYDKLKNAGFAALDSFTYPRTWAFVYKKGDNSYKPTWKFSEGLYDRITLTTQLASLDTLGYINSPVFGPAVAWKQIKWNGVSLETTAGDRPIVSVIGIRTTGQVDTLYKLNASQQDFDISAINATLYPNLKLSMRNADSITLTPYQLRYWRLLYTPVPEGALAPNLSYRGKDTLEVGEPLNFSVAFKNISDAAFADSLKLRAIIYDKNNVATIVPLANKKKLVSGDTTNISAVIDTRNLAGDNTLYIDVNPDFAQPEQYRNNNFLYKTFYIKPDTYNPLMDVTFDGVHILNGDIVAAKPRILITLKDDAKFLALDDTSLATVFVRYPGTNGTLRRFAFGTDTLRFIPANIGSGVNEASIEFNPSFMEDSNGDYYELIVRGKDKSGNNAGTNEYKVRFQVYNKPMISNMFNYPNPFTTSTAFVFTITGSQVPQNLRIQILTITGKIVKDITKDELGPLHVGRNITEYKWDGTDQYGQKLGNGVYLYRVITNLNGATLDRFNTLDANGSKVNTDQYFNKGYGKMYLMR